MEAICAKLKLANYANVEKTENGIVSPEKARRMEVTAVVDSGVHDLFVNEDIRAQLGLMTVEKLLGKRADGSMVECERLEPVEIRFENRWTVTCPLMLSGNHKPVLGVLPIRAMDTVIDAENQKLIVNPAHPDGAVFRI